MIQFQDTRYDLMKFCDHCWNDLESFCQCLMILLISISFICTNCYWKNALKNCIFFNNNNTVKVLICLFQNSFQIFEKFIKNFTKFSIAFSTNSAAITKKSIDAFQKLVEISQKSLIKNQDCETSDVIHNISENIVHFKLHVKLVTFKNLTFVKFSTIINVNHMKKLLIIIRKYNIIHKVLQKHYLEIQKFSFDEWA